MPKIKKLSWRKSPAPQSAYTPIFSRRTKILLFTGLFLMLIPLVFYINQTAQLMFFVPAVPEKVAASVYYPAPTHIDIPKVSISLPIEETVITNHVWGIAPDAVSHLSASVNPGETGPIILYAHNTNDRFGPIRWLSLGDTVLITNKDGKEFTYRVTETVRTDPNELSVFFKRKSETLYLFTCDGFADLQRYIIIAEPTATPSASSMSSS
jgi:LPXTG-site transpeptidase (sortase) family protein